MVSQSSLDLTLASSYIPAFMCLGKSLLVTVLAWFLLPVNGLPTLGVLLLLDRLFLNSDFIVDVNAVVGLMTALRVMAYMRTSSEANVAQLGLGLAWAALGGIQLVRPIVRPRTELLLQCAVLAGLSWTMQPLENLAYALARTSSYVVLTLGHVYWLTAAQDEEPLALTSMRFGPVVLCDASLAAGTSLIGALVIVYKYKYRWHHREVVEGSSDNHDAEAALLRDALARCKDNRSL
jgi:hypothetical protein